MMLYPATMNQHGPARSMEQYLDHLYAELDAERAAVPNWPTARKIDLIARIRDLEAELGAASRL